MKNNKLHYLAILIVMLMLVTFVGCNNNTVEEEDTYTEDTVVNNQPEESESIIEGTELTAFSAPYLHDKLDNEKLMEYGIPEYWLEELDIAVETVRATLATTEEYSSFLWYTDAHWTKNSRNTVSILQCLQDYTGVDYVNFGGDIVNNYNVSHDVIIRTLDEWREATLALPNHYSVVGNHDGDIPELADRNDLYDYLIGREGEKVSNENNKFCYYVDHKEQKTRYVYLHTGFGSVSADDLTFLIDTLNSTYEGWHVVMVSHIWFVYHSSSNPYDGQIPNYVTPILNLIDSYNARSAGEIDYDGVVPFDFTNAGARVEFCIGGHTHVDHDLSTDGGIPIILTETNSYFIRGDTKSTNSIDEASVNAIIADYDNRIIHVIRAGRGDSRTIEMPE